MSLQAALEKQKEEWLAQVGPEIGKLVADDTAALHSVAEGAVKAGQMFPAMSLPNHRGETTNLGTLLSASPLIITFYRGGWCPYCNLELRAYQSILPQIKAAGGHLIAVTPETPDNSLTTMEKNTLTYDVLSDTAGNLAKELRIHYQLSPGIKDLYQRFGLDLPVRHGDGAWSLPLPATYVVNKGGRISLAHVEADFFKRLDPSAALEELKNLSSHAPTSRQLVTP